MSLFVTRAEATGAEVIHAATGTVVYKNATGAYNGAERVANALNAILDPQDYSPLTAAVRALERAELDAVFGFLIDYRGPAA